MKFFKLIFLCSFIFILSACATTSDNSKTQNPIALEPQALLKFSDVPVPVGLKSLPQASYSFESRGVRVGVLKYQGKGDPDLIINFFKEQMPMYNWNLVNIIEYGQRLINFENDNESCIITLTPRGKTLNLTISLGPKSTVLAKKSKAPIK